MSRQSEYKKELTELRQEIGRLDSQLLALVWQRWMTGRKIAGLKVTNKKPIYNPKREAQKMKEIVELFHDCHWGDELERTEEIMEQEIIEIFGVIIKSTRHYEEAICEELVEDRRAEFNRYIEEREGKTINVPDLGGAFPRIEFWKSLDPKSYNTSYRAWLERNDGDSTNHSG